MKSIIHKKGLRTRSPWFIMLVEEPQWSRAQAKESTLCRWFDGYYSRDGFRGELKCHEEEMSFGCDIGFHRFFQSVAKCFITHIAKGKLHFNHTDI